MDGWLEVEMACVIGGYGATDTPQKEKREEGSIAQGGFCILVHTASAFGAMDFAFTGSWAAVRFH